MVGQIFSDAIGLAAAELMQTPQAHRPEPARPHHLGDGQGRRDPLFEGGRHQPQAPLQITEHDALLPEEPQKGSGPHHRMNLAGDQPQQCALAGAIGTEHRRVLSAQQRQAEVGEHLSIPQPGLDRLQLKPGVVGDHRLVDPGQCTHRHGAGRATTCEFHRVTAWKRCAVIEPDNTASASTISIGFVFNSWSVECMIDQTAVRSRRALRTWAHRSTGQASARQPNRTPGIALKHSCLRPEWKACLAFANALSRTSP